MANYREHVSVSALLGLGYGLGATVGFGFTPVQGMLSGCLTAIGGMLPDLDSPNARPVREVFGVVGAMAPLLLVNRITRIERLGIPSDPETIMLLIVCLYLAIKYGGAALINLLSVHRGMFHSIPAMLIAGEAVYLAHPNHDVLVKLLMAGGISIGFLSHLLLDELYSVHMKQNRLQLKRSSGTALKMTGDSFLPNVVTYTLLASLGYAVLADAGLLEQHAARQMPDLVGTMSEPAPDESPPSAAAHPHPSRVDPAAVPETALQPSPAPFPR